KDKESLIRADAIELLGETKDPKYASVYTPALNDQSYSVIDQAAVALGKLKDPKSYDSLVKLAATPSWKGRIENAGLHGLAELGDKRAFDIGYKIATDVNQPQNVRTTALTVVGATGKGDPRAYPLIFEKFKSAADQNEFNGMLNGIQAIIKIADPRGQEAFDMLKN